MSFSTTTIRAFARVIVVTIAAAAFLAPAAQANVTASNLYGPLDPWAYNAIHASARSAGRDVSDSSARNVLQSRAVPRTYGARTASPATVVSSSDGFDWADAGIGAAGGFAFMACAVALALGTRRARREKFAL
jgi:hypothetical protein